jgi:hypothetical protein
MENTNKYGIIIGGSSFNKKTYIGYLKEKDGGMKIIPGDIDNKIISNRNNILNHLEKVLLGGKNLKEKNLDAYFSALGGKYIRNDICMATSTKNCKRGQDVSIGGAQELIKLAINKNFDMNNTLNIFKGSAPLLYETIEKSGGISIPFGKISEGFKKFKTGISKVKKGYKQFKKLKNALTSSDDGDDDNSEGGALNELRDELKLLRK